MLKYMMESRGKTHNEMSQLILMLVEVNTGEMGWRQQYSDYLSLYFSLFFWDPAQKIIGFLPDTWQGTG